MNRALRTAEQAGFELDSHQCGGARVGRHFFIENRATVSGWLAPASARLLEKKARAAGLTVKVTRGRPDNRKPVINVRRWKPDRSAVVDEMMVPARGARGQAVHVVVVSPTWGECDKVWKVLERWASDATRQATRRSRHDAQAASESWGLCRYCLHPAARNSCLCRRRKCARAHKRRSAAAGTRWGRG